MAAAACESKGLKLLQQTVKYAACWSEGDGGERERGCVVKLTCLKHPQTKE